MPEPRELKPIQFFGPDSTTTFSRDYSFQPEKVDEDIAPMAGQPEPKHDPVPPSGPKVPVEAPDAEPIPTSPQNESAEGRSPVTMPVSNPLNPHSATKGQEQVA